MFGQGLTSYLRKSDYAITMGPKRQPTRPLKAHSQPLAHLRSSASVATLGQATQTTYVHNCSCSSKRQISSVSRVFRRFATTEDLDYSSFNPLVVGSSPTALTNKNKGF